MLPIVSGVRGYVVSACNGAPTPVYRKTGLDPTLSGLNRRSNGMTKLAGSLIVLAVIGTFAAAGRAEVTLPGLDSPAVVITADTAALSEPVAHFPQLDDAAPQAEPIVIDAITTAWSGQMVEQVMPRFDATDPTPLVEQRAARYVSIFEPVVVTIAVSYLPGEHTVEFDTRPPGVFAAFDGPGLRFATDRIATDAGLAILTTAGLAIR